MGLGKGYNLGVRRRLDYDSSLLIEKVISDHCKKQLGSLEKFTEENKKSSIIPLHNPATNVSFLSLVS